MGELWAVAREREWERGERRQMKISKSFSFAFCFGTLDLGVDCGLYTCTGVGFSIIICVYLLFRVYFILNMYVLFLCILRGNKRNGDVFLVGVSSKGDVFNWLLFIFIFGAISSMVLRGRSTCCFFRPT